MLDKRESAVMEVIYNACTDKKSCLIKAVNILKEIPYTRTINMEELEEIVNILVLDDYFDVVKTEKDGETVYCFNFHPNGVAFERELIQKKRQIKFKVLLTIGGALGSLALTLIIKGLVG